MAAVRCSACGSHYESDRVEIVGHQEDLWFVAVTCGTCQTRDLVAAMMREATPEEASEAVELSDVARRSEISPASDSSPITHDDLLRMHDFLDGFEGDFKHLFGKED